MGKKDFKGLQVTMIDENREKTRASAYMIDHVTSNPCYDEMYLKNIIDDPFQVEYTIEEWFSIDKRNDPRGYDIIVSTLRYLGGNHRMQESKKIVTLHNTLDIVQLFNTNKKMYNFIAFLLEFATKSKLGEYDIMIQINSSFVIEFNILLHVLTLWIVEYYEADENHVKNYLYSFFSSYDDVSFLMNCIFSHYYRMLSTRVSDMIQNKNKKRNEIRKSWTDALYQDAGGRVIHLRQVAFSRTQIERIIIHAEKNGVDTNLTKKLYYQFLDSIKSPTLTQIMYGKTATDEVNKNVKMGSPITRFFKFER